MNRKERLEKEIRKDKKFEKSMAYCRVKKIFDFLEQGCTSQQIIDRLNDLPKVRPDKRGQESVNNVKKAINNLPFIQKIQETSHHSFEDMCLKYDLIAILPEEAINFVGIQVKSSERAVLEFYQKINPDNLEIQNILIKKQLIVLNGQNPKAEIRQDFLRQYSIISDFYINNPQT